MIKNADNPRASAIERAAAWNEAHPVGTFVRHWQSLPANAWMIAPTTSTAFVHGHGAAVYVMGARMPVYLSKLEPLSAEALAILTHDDAVERGNVMLSIAARERPYLSPAVGGEHDMDSPRPTVRDVHELQLPPGDRS